MSIEYCLCVYVHVCFMLAILGAEALPRSIGLFNEILTTLCLLLEYLMEVV